MNEKRIFLYVLSPRTPSLRRFFPREEGEKYFSSSSSFLSLHSFPGGESTPRKSRGIGTQSSDNETLAEKGKLHPFPSNRINRGVLAAVDRAVVAIERVSQKSGHTEMRNTARHLFSLCSFRSTMRRNNHFFSVASRLSIGKRLHEIND